MATSQSISRWLSFAATLMFAGATFAIVSDRWLLAVVFFAAATTFVCAAMRYRIPVDDES